MKPQRRISPIRAGAVAAVTLAILTSGCMTSARIPYTAAEQSGSQPAGMANVRFWADASLSEIKAAGIGPPPSASKRDTTYLALSGGGSAGAFGAGLLIAWTKRGDRPKFDIVSGVSTGALIAPFAFLGPVEDEKLKTVFTSGVAESLFKPREPISAILGPSLLHGEPLAKLIARYVDASMLERIAAESRRGRTLLVVTTNLDAQRPVVWDLTRIAASGRPGALDLVRKVMQASASLPGIYPAVPIDVVSGTRTHTELHSDGGVSTQVFVAPDVILIGGNPNGKKRPPQISVYVVINNTLEPEFTLAKSSTIAVATRAYSSIVKSSTVSSVNAAYALARRSGAKFHLAYIDQRVPWSGSDPFNSSYMLKVFDLGYAHGLAGDWQLSPPVVK